MRGVEYSVCVPDFETSCLAMSGDQIRPSGCCLFDEAAAGFELVGAGGETTASRGAVFTLAQFMDFVLGVVLPRVGHDDCSQASDDDFGGDVHCG